MPKKSDYKNTHIPTQPAEHTATKSTPVKGLAGLAEGGVSNARSHVPERGPGHSAQRGNHVDGMKNIAKDIMHTKEPTRPPSPKSAGKNTNKGA